MNRLIFLLILPALFATSILYAATVRLSWNANVEPDMSAYNVYQDGECVATVQHPETSADLNLFLEKQYSFRVSALDKSGNESELSDVCLFVLDLTPPVQPVIASTTVKGKDVILTWPKISDAVSYNVYCDGTFKASTSNLTYTVTGLSEGQHTLTIDAVDSSENRSVRSAAVTVNIDTTAPAKPTGLKAFIQRLVAWLNSLRG